MTDSANASPGETVETAPDRRARLYRTRAIVLRRRDIGEVDRLLTLLTDQRGRCRVVAKGVRKPGSRLAGHLEPFCVSSTLIARTRGLDIVSQAEMVDAFTALRTDEASIATAGYFAELLDLLVPEEQPHEGLFELTRSVLELLDRGSDRRAVTCVFEMGLLRQLGYRPRLDPCIYCGTSLTQEVNWFSPEGGVVCSRCARGRPGLEQIDVPGLKILRAIDRGEIERVLRLHVSSAVWSEIDASLVRYISRIIGREPESLKVMRDLRLE